MQTDKSIDFIMHIYLVCAKVENPENLCYSVDWDCARNYGFVHIDLDTQRLEKLHLFYDSCLENMNVVNLMHQIRTQLTNVAIEME